MYEIISLNKYIKAKNPQAIITCKCKYQILLLPDMKAMNRAIENHLKKHLKTSRKQIEENLIAQIFDVINTYETSKN